MNLFDSGNSNQGLVLSDQTVVEPIVLIATLLLGAILFVLPRKQAAVPFILLACFLPVSQRVAIAELDFNMLRILLLFGWARVFLLGEFRDLRIGRLDYAMFGWVAIASVVYTIGRGGLDDAIFRAGKSYDLLGLYIVFRCWIRDIDSLRTAVVSAALSSVVVAFFMVIEFSTGRNFFSIFGGVPEITLVRDGRLRCQATFRHPILAGSMGAAVAPLCLWLFVQRGRQRAVGALGWLASTAIVVLSSSSGPLLGWLAGMGACALWFVRPYLHFIRWGVVAFLLILHLVANRPVWHWIAAMNVIGASTSYHRVALIDAAIKHFPEWALLGTESTAHWGYYMFDVTNQYILEGVRGGVWSMVALVVVLALAFRYVGRARLRLRDLPQMPGGRRNASLMVWALGAMLFVHAVNFLGVSYFGQIEVYLVLTLAMIAGALDAAENAGRESSHATPSAGPGQHRVRALLRPTASITW